ncbi:haloacid dehalogenase-like hydrolase domain-containing protein 3 [Senna tora]|uniref:Haloacid dehalogenase-like hydrolase domain-containing protein 3 n=1 Tax=Senna tora TaxID=362788 RepID=A0A834XCV4_9FABA|nr:haloacid dehalogenase-like hydrolase domain-containing protein 3 [Senna tora]
MLSRSWNRSKRSHTHSLSLSLSLFLAVVSITVKLKLLPKLLRFVPSVLLYSWVAILKVSLDSFRDNKRPAPQLISAMAILSLLRCITIDVTGTLIAYKGQLGDYYCLAAKAVGLPCPDYKRVHDGFKLAYKDMAQKYPCFGFAAGMSSTEWWKTCVRNSFSRAGYDYDDETYEKIFNSIHATFGSSTPYTVFPDSQPFLRWVRQQGVKVGIVSNSEHRYPNTVLPAFDLKEGSEWDFGVFSGIEGVEKPNPKIFEIALERAGNIAPKEVLHIGDSMRKDYEPAKSMGMHALLLDRFKTQDAMEWRKSGATVLPDLLAAQEWLSSGKSSC